MFLAIAIIAVILLVPEGFAAPRAVKACRDGSDNDGDGYTDWPDDPGCQNKNDNSELNLNIECDDGSDNDGDDDIDMNDGGCSSPTDDDETNCGDGVCEGGETSGTCPADCGEPDSCSDTDGGDYPFTFGTTSGYYDNSPYENDDYCLDSSNVMEYYCSGDYEQSSSESCGTDYYNDSYCIGNSVYKDYTDFFCSSGECDMSTYPVLQENCTGDETCVDGECVIADSCSDTDGGIATGVQGTVSGYDDEIPYNYTDYCNSTTSVYEYFCSGNDWYGFPMGCNATETCVNGACV